MLARKNERHCERLRGRRRKLERHIAQETSWQEERRRAVYEQALLPFRDGFRLLKRAALPGAAGRVKRADVPGAAAHAAWTLADASTRASGHGSGEGSG